MKKKNDINIKVGEYILNCTTVALIEKDNKILLQKKNLISIGHYQEEK